MQQRKIFKQALALTAGLLLAGSVQAQDWKAIGEFGWFGVGKAHEVEKGHFYWVGEFSGTFFSDKGKGGLFHLAGVKCPAFNDLNFATGKGKAGGYCIITDTDGDKALASWQAQGDNVTGRGTFTFTSGSGKYQGISGTYPFTGVTQINWSDGTASGYSTWNR